MINLEQDQRNSLSRSLIESLVYLKETSINMYGHILSPYQRTILTSKFFTLELDVKTKKLLSTKLKSNKYFNYIEENKDEILIKVSHPDSSVYKYIGKSEMSLGEIVKDCTSLKEVYNNLAKDIIIY